MSIPRSVPLPCGCVAIWNDLEGQYNSQCCCSAEVKRVRRLAERAETWQRRWEARRRRESALYYRPFSLLR